ncbi:uncharacterized protein LOC115718916 [Cannabis sativa]|uniref:uncharacterized protein LOC115718916 n=1 Tax=Cannabis sativa TaxID=3483 RepID=UPI0029C9D0F1|nr:uncharacterized protein LOC115718916 [Cannabis sativa]
MNDQSQMMNQAQMMSLNQQSQMMMMNQSSSSQPLMNQSQMMSAGQSQQPLPLRHGYNKVWSSQQQQQQNQQNQQKQDKFQNSSKPNFSAQNQGGGGRNNWKGKKNSDPRRNEPVLPSGPNSYKPPTLHELQSQNRLKARKFYPKKKFNNRFAPYAPRNTTSFIIRAKKSGGIASLVSPCPVTPAVLPTPIFSPSREILGDMAKEEWGVDGYGSMKGLIRLRSPGNDNEDEDDDEEGESDVEEHVEVERRLDHDLSRFEMIYPNYSGMDYNNVLENRVDDQDTHIAQLEEENLTLKERLFLMERELSDFRRRLQFLERQSNLNHGVVGDVHEEVVENESENESDGGSGAPDLSGHEGSRDFDGDSKEMEELGHNDIVAETKDEEQVAVKTGEEGAEEAVAEIEEEEEEEEKGNSEMAMAVENGTCSEKKSIDEED